MKVHEESEPASELEPEHTLKPIHFRLPYYLSFQNLYCMQRCLEHTTDSVFVSNLAHHDSVAVDEVEYRWSNEIYFGENVFVQKQEM